MNTIIELLEVIIFAILMVLIVCATIICGIIMDVPDIIIKILVIGEFLFSIVIRLDNKK
jgi:hypothetical protein